MRNKQGLGLIEVLIVTMLTGGIVVFIGMALKGALKGRSSFLSKSDVKTNLVNLVENISQVGRIAHTCTVVAGPPLQLNCTVDTQIPPTTTNAADDTVFSFEYRKSSTNCKPGKTTNCMVVTQTRNGQNREIVYQLGDDLPSHAAHQEHFTVCDDAAISAGTCTIGPNTGDNDINRAHIANLGAEPPEFDGRFFRFLLSAVDPDYPKGRPFSIQTAFFRRNPIPGFGDELRYQWGAKE